MTVSAASNFELTRDGLLRRSFQLAGALEVSQNLSSFPDDTAAASDLLGAELQALQGEGIVITHRVRTTTALVAGTAAYSLGTDILDVFIGPDNVAGTIVPSSGAETPVRAIPQHEYVQISDKTTQATPTLVLIERHAPVTLTFWQVPIATASFRYTSIRFPRDVDEGSDTFDMSRRWQKYLLYSMAWQIAMFKSQPLPRVKMLKEMADEAKGAALRGDVEKTHIQLVPVGYG